MNNKISGLEAPDNVSSKPLIISCYIIITFVLAIIILSLKYFPNSFYIAIGASGLVSAISLHILLYYQNKTYKKLLDTSNNLRALSYIDNTLSILDQSQIPAVLEKNQKIIRYNKLAKEITNVHNIQIISESCWQINTKIYQILRCEIDNQNIAILIDSKQNTDTILTFLMNSDLANAIIDKDYNVKYGNKTFTTMLDLEVDNPLNMSHIISEADYPIFKELVDSVNLTNKPSCSEFAAPKSKKTLEIHVSKARIEDNIYFVCKVFDLTEHKQLQTNLVHSQKMQAIGQLAGSIAHDFNNLLTAMIGFCDILLLNHGPSSSSFNEIMQIKQNANRAAALVRQLLAFSRKQVLSLKVLNINNVMLDLSSLLTRLLGDKVKFKIEYGKRINNITADQTQLEQVIINLAVNARDAMEEGGVLTIKTSNYIIDDSFDEKAYHAPIGYTTIPHGEYVLITICDNGTGIPKDIIDKIFEPFFSTKDSFSGTGLGLATVYGIVKQIGGHIRFQTEHNKGTCFYIFLSIVERNIKNPEKMLESPILEEDEFYMQNHTKSKILIVEDEAPVRLFEVHALNSKGYSVIDTADAESAMKYLEYDGANINVVITDVMMPGMTGPEMVEKVRLKYPHIKFIFTSGYTEDSLSYFENNNHHFLAKPFSLNDLLKTVKDVLEKDE